MRRPVCLALASLVVLAVSCGDAGPDVAAPDDSLTVSLPAGSTVAPGDSPNGGPTDPQAPAPPPAGQGGAGRAIAWILSLGPSAPEGPGRFEIYDAVRRLDCDDVAMRAGGLTDEVERDVRRLYEGMAAACRAAFQGQDDLWSEAESALLLSRLADGLSCFDVAVRELLQRLVQAHEDDPEATYRAATGANEAATPRCPAITGISPSSGPSGTLATISGNGFDAVTEVRLYHPDSGAQGVLVDSSTEQGSIVVEVDAGGYLGTACLVLIAQPDEWKSAGVLFEVEPGPDHQGSSQSEPGQPACPPPTQ